MQQTENLVSVDQHVLQFKDAEAKLSGIWTNDPFKKDKGLGIAEGSIWLTDFSRAAGMVPVLTEVHTTAPATDDLDDYDGVIEGDLTVKSGRISVENESGSQAEVKLPAGKYRARVYYAAKDTCRYDYSDGAEHARLVLFNGAPGPVKILKPIKNENDPVRTYQGKRTLPELEKMLTAESISHRCIAVVALLRLGELDRVMAALPSSPAAVKHVAASSLWFAGDRAEPHLAKLAKDADPDLRTRAAQSLGFLKSAGARTILDSLCNDTNPEVKEAAKFAIEGLS